MSTFYIRNISNFVSELHVGKLKTSSQNGGTSIINTIDSNTINNTDTITTNTLNVSLINNISGLYMNGLSTRKMISVIGYSPVGIIGPAGSYFLNKTPNLPNQISPVIGNTNILVIPYGIIPFNISILDETIDSDIRLGVKNPNGTPAAPDTNFMTNTTSANVRIGAIVGTSVPVPYSIGGPGESGPLSPNAELFGGPFGIVLTTNSVVSSSSGVKVQISIYKINTMYLF